MCYVSGERKSGRDRKQKISFSNLQLNVGAKVIGFFYTNKHHACVMSLVCV
jgi:hypothetical protein